MGIFLELFELVIGSYCFCFTKFWYWLGFKFDLKNYVEWIFAN